MDKKDPNYIGMTYCCSVLQIKHEGHTILFYGDRYDEPGKIFGRNLIGWYNLGLGFYLDMNSDVFKSAEKVDLEVHYRYKDKM